ncbi:Protein of unknown function [Micromonospora lupini str. Lupac 08]|uniref:Secreted protein n=1 Tax=Micromonospora lupini str. Lupac 08 TaxID=1150864 RepID=I0KW49_9ACTN|nr:Protein of unknown function [Micromonospora lupini str. Lupac 08]
MSARHLLLLPVVTVLIGLSACDSGEPAGPSPTASAPTSAAGAPSASPAAASPAAGTADCPTATALQTLVELPKDWSFGEVKCFKDWATADPQGPTAGDGVYLFRYVAGTGWKYYDQGSDWDCKDLGISEAPFCVSEPTKSAPKSAPKPSSGTATSAKCPSAKTLEALVELPKGWTFGSVDCVKDWAGADPEGPGVGDGSYLFHFVPGTGWKYYGDGSGYDCVDLGLKEAPFCIY